MVYKNLVILDLPRTDDLIIEYLNHLKKRKIDYIIIDHSSNTIIESYKKGAEYDVVASAWYNPISIERLLKQKPGVEMTIDERLRGFFMASTISESDVYKSVYKRRSKLAFSSLITRYKPDNIMKVDTSVVVPAPLAKNVVFDVLNLVHNMIPGRSAPSLAKFYGASRGFKYHENIIATLLSDPTIARIEAINPKQLAMPVALFGLEKNIKLIGQAEEIDELKLSNLLRDFVGEPDVQIIKVDAPHELDYVEPTSRIIVIVGAGVGPERIRAYTMAKFRNYHYYGYTGHSGISILVRD